MKILKEEMVQPIVETKIEVKPVSISETMKRGEVTLETKPSVIQAKKTIEKLARTFNPGL